LQRADAPIPPLKFEIADPADPDTPATLFEATTRSELKAKALDVCGLLRGVLMVEGVVVPDTAPEDLRALGLSNGVKAHALLKAPAGAPIWSPGVFATNSKPGVAAMHTTPTASIPAPTSFIEDALGNRLKDGIESHTLDKLREEVLQVCHDLDRDDMVLVLVGPSGKQVELEKLDFNLKDVARVIVHSKWSWELVGRTASK
jgi:hypothetical protein